MGIGIDMNLLHSSSIFFWYCNALDRITGKEKLLWISIGLYLKQLTWTAELMVHFWCFVTSTTLPQRNMINQLFLLLAVNVFDFLSSVCVFNSMYTSTKKKTKLSYPTIFFLQYFKCKTSGINFKKSRFTRNKET